MKTRISAPAHPSATGIGRVSGLVCLLLKLGILPAIADHVRTRVMSNVITSEESCMGVLKDNPGDQIKQVEACNRNGLGRGGGAYPH